MVEFVVLPRVETAGVGEHEGACYCEHALPPFPVLSRSAHFEYVIEQGNTRSFAQIHLTCLAISLLRRPVLASFLSAWELRRCWDHRCLYVLLTTQVGRSI